MLLIPIQYGQDKKQISSPQAALVLLPTQGRGSQKCVPASQICDCRVDGVYNLFDIAFSSQNLHFLLDFGVHKHFMFCDVHQSKLKGQGTTYKNFSSQNYRCLNIVLH